jgi:ABC-2 type transport system ATP-binding protein
MSIEANHLQKLYGHQKAVDDLTFVAPKNSITGFLGPNGAGKSTTMKIATGYLNATSGDVILDGISVSKDPLRVKRNVGYLPENNPLYLDMYVREFLTFTGRAYGLKGNKLKSRVEEMIELTGLTVEAKKQTGKLSKGYRQRVGLAKALISDPPILIMDEPTTGLDPNQIIEIRNLIKNISVEKTVLLSTHIMQEVEALCDKVVIINKGKLLVDDEVTNLKRSASNSFKVSFETNVDPLPFEQDGRLVSVKQLSRTELVITTESAEGRKLILDIASNESLPLISISQQGDSLEDIFQTLTSEGK